MSRNALRIESLRLTRIRGLRQGDGFVLENLSPGINVIHGPNGSGKTTTAYAIQELLWPGCNRLERPTISGRLIEGSHRWDIDIDAGHFTCRCNGYSATPPQTGAPEMRARYWLALHELIAADDAGFAHRIIMESQGGFDLVRAIETLGFRISPHIGRTESRAFMEARSRERDARHQQELLEADASRLEELRREMKEAARARAEVVVLDRALEYQRAAVTCEECTRLLATFPPEVERLRGDERERVRRIDARIEEARARFRESQGQLRAAESEISSARLPDEGVDGARLREWRDLQRRARDCEATLATCRRERNRAAAFEEQLRRRLSAAISPAELVQLQSVHIEPLGDLARRVDRLRASESALAERLRWLEPVKAMDPDSEEEPLRRGIAALHEWLTAVSGLEPGAPLIPWAGTTACIGLAVFSVVLAVQLHVGWIAGGVAALALLAFEVISWVNRSRAFASMEARAAVHREAYAATGLGEPEAWETDAVQECLRGHLARLSALTLEARRAELRREAEAELAELEAERAAVDEVVQRVEAALGITLSLDREWLPLFLETLSQWQKASDELRAAEEQIARIEPELERCLRDLAAVLQPFGYPAPSTATVAGEHLDDLNDRRQRHERARERVTEISERIHELEAALKGLSNERAELLRRLGVPESGEELLDVWLRRLPERQELARKLKNTEAVRDEYARALTDRKELLARGRDALERLRAEANELAQRYEGLAQEVAGIEARINAAMRSFDLTDALATVAERKAGLEAARDKAALAAVGSQLADWVRASVDRSRPQVFRRARELLLAFTHGKLVLELEDRAGGPQFLARDGDDSPRPVDQLSVGERVQLLMAVRLAFLEQDEAVRLPLLLDEALGTCDDTRAAAVIEAVREIAGSGRQVFYFTANRDDAARWRALIGDSVPHAIHDLAAIRRMEERPFVSVPKLPPESVPEPGELDYAAYGQRLNVPGVNPRMSVERLHLWHVLDDTGLLHRLLCQQVHTWGQLKALMEHGGAGRIDPAEPGIHRAEAVARAFEAAFDAWRVGRGQPVNREALIESYAVSATFLDRIAALSAEVQGDARELLRRLERGMIGRWRQDNTAKLRQYFIEHGYLSEADPLSPEDLRVRVLASVGKDLQSGLLNPERLEQVLCAVMG